MKPCTVQAPWWHHPALISVYLAVGFGTGALYAHTASAADATAAPASSAPHTVTWYADNPQTRARVELLCLDNPGQLGSNPDCINAHQAAIVIAARQAKAHIVQLDPNSPAFWSADPEARQNKLLMCRRNPGLLYCEVAKRSLVVEAGSQKR